MTAFPPRPLPRPTDLASRADNGPSARPTAAARSGDELSAADVRFLRSLVLERSAIVLDESKQYLLASRLDPIVRKEQLGSISDLVNGLRLAPRGRLEGLVIEAMTTNETSFFRDIHPFAALTDSVIPEIVAQRGAAAGLTIWCGACSSGQEPYSVAIAIAEKFPELVMNSRLRIVATDLAPNMVERTKAGRFSQLEVNRGLPVKLLMRHFQQDGTEWVASRQIRQMMDVRIMNLIGQWPAMPKCDIVFLRNVLIYFNPETKRQILERIRGEVLRPGGHLFLGSSETTINIDNAWTRRTVGRSISYEAPASGSPSAALAAPHSPARPTSPARPLAAAATVRPLTPIAPRPFPTRPAASLPLTQRQH
jgi:chemotaxis protein methyltransferase CheR